jgi:diguanylate cyclase (GGDEF)-like protein
MKFAASHTDNKKTSLDLFLWPSVILLLGLSLTGAAWRYASIKEDEKLSAAFNLHTHDASRDVQKCIEIYFGVLHSAGGFFAGSNSVTRAEFERFVSFLKLKEKYPGIEGMGVIRYIPHSQKNKFENTVRRENGHGWADYTIRPPGVREAYYPVEYFWPPLNHISLPGLDHGAYPSGFKALQKARDTGLVTMSTTLPYAQGDDYNPPILFMFPIYRNGWPIATLDERQKAIWGFVYARVNVTELFQGAISSSVADEIYLEVFDGEGSDQESTSLDQTRLIYDADPSEIPHARDASYKPRHSATQKVAIDGTYWLFYASSRPGGTIEQRDDMPLFILFAGGFFSLGASVLTLMRNRGKQLIHHLAYYDCLTSLPNRSLLQDRFQQALANAQRHGTGMALLFLDLDKFKPVNDSLGHEAGDEVLKTVSARLASCLREGDTLSRFGGDEFVVLLLNITGREEVSSVAQKIIDITSEPIPLKRQNAQVGCSIGISIFPKDGADFDALLKTADAAMYRAKENGRNNFQFYPGMLSGLATPK